jgi:hypothetical protein
MLKVYHFLYGNSTKCVADYRTGRPEARFMERRNRMQPAAAISKKSGVFVELRGKLWYNQAVFF